MCVCVCVCAFCSKNIKTEAVYIRISINKAIYNKFLQITLLGMLCK